VTSTWVVWILAAVLLSGCSLGGKKKDAEREKTEQLTETQLYDRVQELLDDERYQLAVKNLQLLESRFPFGTYAEQAQLEIIYAYYRNFQEDAAIAAAERFLRLHPNHENADYAWYMKGLANYSLEPGVLGRFYDRDFGARDVEPARQSFREFQEFLRLFPDSPYAADARVRMIHIRHILARHEVHIANYYVKRRAFVAAIRRAQEVLNRYQQTDAVADALAALTYCYEQLGMADQMQKNLSVLALNYPQHPSLDKHGNFRYTDDAWNPHHSVVDRLTLGLFDAPRIPQFDSRP
jgi:outer membrane protein assembly factor BamD